VAGADSNAFAGTKGPEKGLRAWPGAPPTIPHPTNMRGECLSCHGPDGKVGMRSSHPWRVSCRQCHVEGSGTDERPFFERLVF
jgi:cytochrome c-type protein NapB